ncbi:ABC transporter substrate-binding protein [Salinirubrum litoreum]|uniref:ABC transporter substrate-binding protein n=1 Tax=Salinirubrum litoreum TaxID=1126234 RepID=A0ABD5R665_9EURY|nr:ABC transporter substrate-binding protein [Salinirubrum litoreum]
MSQDDSVDRRRFLKAVGGATATAALAGCQQQDPGTETDTGTDTDGDMDDTETETDDGDDSADVSGTLVYARGDHPTNYDPQQTTSGEVAKVTNQIFDQLVGFVPGSGGELTEGLATDFSLEGTTATLTLREGVTFHNGAEFTAADVRATIRRFIDSEYEYYLGDDTRSGYGPFTFGNWVDSVDDSSDYEVTIELTQQYAPFLRNLAMFAASILSQQQIESLGSSQADLGANPQGTGVFSFDQLDNGNQRVLLAANTDYFGDGPNVEQVVFKTIGQNSTRVQDVINGDSHITDNLDSQSSQQADNADTASLESKNGINVGYMAFNMARKEEFRDRRVRRAISYAVNTEAIVNQIYQGFATQADQPLPPDVAGYNEDLDPYPTDTDEALSLFEDAGISSLEFELATFSNPRGYNPSPIETANQVKSDLEGLSGVDITVNINQFSTFSSYLDYTDQGRHDACFLGWYTDNADPDNFLYVLLDPKVPLDAVPDGQDWVSYDTEGYSTLNAAGWANTEYMQLVRDAQATYDDSERTSAYQEANQIAHDEAPWVFIDYAQTLRAVNQAVSGYTVSSVGGPFLNTVSLDN